ncbi:MAG: class II fructose-bisphosphate aldolase [Oscillospiraceae bacterium]|nr:class II fructose-bisphosphate aldolase [Oscillospiraceae bacterium]
MLENVRALLTDGWKRGYGLAAINVFNYESIAWAVKAAEREQTPILIQFYPGYIPFVPMKTVADMAMDCIEKASVPIGLHLDHSAAYELAVGGLGAGFPSVMIDKSTDSYAVNAAETAAVVRAAHAMGAVVESELGHVGSAANLDDFTNPNHFTDVEQAARFAAETGADSLAVSVGNGHGAYVRTPELDFDRIRALRAALDIPLVLHGCSDIPVEQLQRAVELGISKFNIATEYDRQFYNALHRLTTQGEKKYTAHYPCLLAIEEEMIAFVQEKIRILNPNRVSCPGSLSSLR